MLFNVALFSSLLLSPVVLALPSGLGARIARRGQTSQGNNRLERTAGVGAEPGYDYHYAGASLSEVTTGTFNGVTATFIAPKVTGSNGSSAIMWASIDGISCPNMSLAVAVPVDILNDENTTYSAWYQWQPHISFQSFPDPIEISAGNVIRLTVNVSSPTSSNVTVENLTNRKNVSKTLTSSTPLCGQDVQWSVLSYGSGGHLIPLADFGTLTYTNAYATGEYCGNNSWFSPFGATTRDMVQNNKILTNVTTEETSVTIEYLA